MSAAVPHRTTLFAAAAFAAAFGGSAWVSATAGSSPRASLYRAAEAYHRALFRGDAEAAVRLVAAPGEAALQEHFQRARVLKGRAWMINGLATGEPGQPGEVKVIYLEGRHGLQQREAWRSDGEGSWRLVHASLPNGGD